MVHPYINRRQGKEAIEYPSGALQEVLGKTFGVPLFQEQAMQIAVVGAGFSPEEADHLRRSLATFRKMGTIGTFRDRFVRGMLERGYEEDFADRCFSQIEGFGEYGFPESHAAAFAMLAYVSAWLKRHHPAVFACALLNSQPMGFMRPRKSCRMHVNTASKFAPFASTIQTGTTIWNGAAMGVWPCDWGFDKSRG